MTKVISSRTSACAFVQFYAHLGGRSPDEKKIYGKQLELPFCTCGPKPGMRE